MWGFLRDTGAMAGALLCPGRKAQAADEADGQRGLAAIELRHLTTSGLVIQQTTKHSSFKLRKHSLAQKYDPVVSCYVFPQNLEFATSVFPVWFRVFWFRVF